MVSHPDTSPTLQDAITALPAVEGHSSRPSPLPSASSSLPAIPRASGFRSSCPVSCCLSLSPSIPDASRKYPRPYPASPLFGLSSSISTASRPYRRKYRPLGLSCLPASCRFPQGTAVLLPDPPAVILGEYPDPFESRPLVGVPAYFACLLVPSFSFSSLKGFGAAVLNPCVVVLLCRPVHTLRRFEGCWKYGGRIFGVKILGKCSGKYSGEYSLKELLSIGGGSAMPVGTSQDTRRRSGDKKLGAATNTPGSIFILPGFFPLPVPHTGVSTGSENERQRKGTKQTRHRQKPFSCSKAKDGKRTPPVKAKRRVRQITPYPSFDRHPAAGVMAISR